MSDLMKDIRESISYVKKGDYYLPDLSLPKEHLRGPWGRMKLRRMQQHDPIMYQVQLLSGTLIGNLNDMNDRAEKLYQQLVKEMKAARGATEQLKEQDQMAWVRLMNSIDHAAREIVLSEVVYAE